jgi:hypothetical protein
LTNFLQFIKLEKIANTTTTNSTAWKNNAYTIHDFYCVNPSSNGEIYETKFKSRAKYIREANIMVNDECGMLTSDDKKAVDKAKVKAETDPRKTLIYGCNVHEILVGDNR